MAFYKRTVKDIPLNGKTVLVRVDYNVPLRKKGDEVEVRDDLRLRASLPTLRYLLERQCKVVLLSHLGRPKGVEAQFSLEPVATRLAELLEKNVKFVSVCIGDAVRQAVRKAPLSSVTMLENVRFHDEEEANDEAFARKIAKSVGADYFVQDGFGVVHRSHASTDAITRFIPSVAGLLLEREYITIMKTLESPRRPLISVIGGAKVSDKLGVFERLVEVSDKIIVGGAMANTFLTYKGHDMGSSIVEPHQEEALDGVYLKVHERLARDGNDESAETFIELPKDVAVAKRIDEKEERRNLKLGAVTKDDIALDIGDASIERMVKAVEKAGTVLWNGTLGYAELPSFAHGSARLALALASHPDITSVIGGGDTADFVLSWEGNGGESFTHVSTGGGAALELIAGNILPGLDCLLDSPR